MQMIDPRERVRTNPLEADLNSRRLARKVHAKDGMHTCAGLATEENHRKWFSSQAPNRDTTTTIMRRNERPTKLHRIIRSECRA
ncbi:hypothetical protein [Rhodanobacter sp. B05]|uniref:hypothetical protein n=1 Tax=Rhodanobacter sp. B05 TaxID=1945859 RepID=UPI0011157159|nr:hypothetical protein [Rhodanobacter sp. B05]